MVAERIGEFLVNIGAIKTYQAEDVIRAQRTGDTRLFGEIAIELRYINEESVKKYIEAKAAWG